MAFPRKNSEQQVTGFDGNPISQEAAEKRMSAALAAIHQDRKENHVFARNKQRPVAASSVAVLDQKNAQNQADLEEEQKVAYNEPSVDYKQDEKLVPKSSAKSDELAARLKLQIAASPRPSSSSLQDIPIEQKIENIPDIQDIILGYIDGDFKKYENNDNHLIAQPCTLFGKKLDYVASFQHVIRVVVWGLSDTGAMRDIALLIVRNMRSTTSESVFG